MRTLEQEKRRHSIIDWTVTLTFVVLMVVLTMKSFMTANKELFILGITGLIMLFAFAKFKLARWGKRLCVSESDDTL